MNTLEATVAHVRIDGRGIDSGIAREVQILQANGVETTESCQGGQGHPFPEPTVRFAGGQSEGPRVLGIALQHGLRVTALRRVWTIIDGEMVGPGWEMTFDHPEGGEWRTIRSPVSFDGDRPLDVTAPPTLGADNDAIVEPLRRRLREA